MNMKAYMYTMKVQLSNLKQYIFHKEKVKKTTFYVLKIGYNFETIVLRFERK